MCFPQVTHHSLLYETAPVGITDQPAFLNGAVAATTQLPPRELLRALKAVEVREVPVPGSLLQVFCFVSLVR